jgi:hypothetical protein
MTRYETRSVRINIAAPDGITAFALERRLRHLKPTTVASKGIWVVELEDDEDRLDEIEAAIRHWLRECGLASTSMTVDGAVRTVPQLPTSVPKLGAGYDGPQVLEHEP